MDYTMGIALSRVLWNSIDIISRQYRIVNQTEVSTYLTIPKKLFRLIWENEGNYVGVMEWETE